MRSLRLLESSMLLVAVVGLAGPAAAQVEVAPLPVAEPGAEAELLAPVEPPAAPAELPDPGAEAELLAPVEPPATPAELPEQALEQPPGGEPALTAPLRQQLRAAVDALAIGDFVAARASLAAIVASLPADHWLLPSLAGLGTVADRMESGLALKCPELGRDDESIASLYTTSTIFGFYTGVYLFSILGELNEQAAIPLSVVTAGVGLGAAYLLDQQEFLTGPVADGIAGGMVIGAVEASLVVAATADFDSSEKLGFGLIWGGALAGAVVGGAVTDATGATRGDVALTTSAFTWGLAAGLFASLIIEYDIDDGPDSYLWTVAGGGMAGLAAGAGLASHYDMSPARVLYINLGGLGGALVGLGVVVGAEMDTARAIGATFGLTYLGGLALGAYLTRDLDDAGLGMAIQAMPTFVAGPDPHRRPAPGMALSLTW